MTDTVHAAVSLTPAEAVKHDCRCPVCGKKVTVGVMHRVEELADRKEGFRPAGSPPYIIPRFPCPRLSLKFCQVGVSSKAVQGTYFSLLQKLGNEFAILMKTPLEDIESAGSRKLREAVAKMRAGDVYIVPGYDGVFGKIRLFGKIESASRGSGESAQRQKIFLCLCPDSPTLRFSVSVFQNSRLLSFIISFASVIYACAPVEFGA